MGVSEWEREAKMFHLLVQYLMATQPMLGYEMQRQVLLAVTMLALHRHLNLEFQY